MSKKASKSKRGNPLDPKKLLHQLEGPMNQLTYMEQRSEEVFRFLNVILERSYAEAPCRKGDYKLDRKRPSKLPDSSEGERRLEMAIWEQWQHEECKSKRRSFIPWICRFILSYQMPLWNARGDKERSGKFVDLMGVSQQLGPVVIELKEENAKDTPLRMLVEALGYGVAVRKAWNEGDLCAQWPKVAPHCSTHSVLHEVPLVCLAPAGFWAKRIGNPDGKRVEHQVFEPAWEPFHKLVTACVERGFPVTFAEFDECKRGGDELPKILNPRAIVLPCAMPSRPAQAGRVGMSAQSSTCLPTTSSRESMAPNSNNRGSLGQRKVGWHGSTC